MAEPRITESEAKRLWERAAELQAQAMQELEARARELREARLLEETGDADPSEPRTSDPFGEGYGLEDVREAARGAGIRPDFVDRALAELEHERRHLSTPPDVVDRVADRLLDGPTGSLSVRGLITGEGQAVLASLNRVLTGRGYGLTLVDMKGDDPLRGATLSFRVPSFSGMSTGQDFSYRAAWIWSDTLLVTVRPAPSDPEAKPSRWEVEFLMPLRKGRRVNAWGSVFTGGATGLVGGALGAAAGIGLGTVVALPAAIAGVALAGAAAAGAGGGGWGGVILYRMGWRHGAKSMEALLEETLRQVALHARTGGVFTLPPSESESTEESGGSPWPTWLISS